MARPGKTSRRRRKLFGLTNDEKINLLAIRGPLRRMIGSKAFITATEFWNEFLWA